MRAASSAFPDARLWRLGQELFWVVVGQVVAALGGIAGVRLLTGALPPASYGELALGITVAMLAQQSLMGPLAQALLRYFGPALEAGQLSAYLGGIRRWIVRTTVAVAALAILAVLALLATGQHTWLWMVIAALGFSLVSGYGAVVDGVQTAARQRIVVAWHQGLGQWARPALALAAIAILGATSVTAMVGYLLASLIVLASQVIFLWRRLTRYSVRPSADANEVEEYARRFYSYAWPFSAWGVLTWLQASSDRWALQAVHGAQSVGVYAATYQIGYQPLVIVANSLVQLVAPILFTRAGDGSDPRRLKEALHLGEIIAVGMLAMTVVVAAVIGLFHGQLFALLVAPAYRGSSGYLPWLVLAGGLFASGQAASLVLMTGLSSRSLIAPKIGTAVAGVLLNVIGAWLFGLAGVVAASVLFAGGYLVWTLTRMRGFMKQLGGQAPLVAQE